MSFPLDKVRDIDAELDRLYLSRLQQHESASGVAATSSSDKTHDGKALAESQDLDTRRRVDTVISLLKALSSSATNGGSPLLSRRQVRTILAQARDELSGFKQAEDAAPPEPHEHSSPNTGTITEQSSTTYELDLHWLLVSKITAQIYGLVCSTFLEQTMVIDTDLWYWEEVLDSKHWLGLHYIQISPIRLWHWGTEVFEETRSRRSLGLRDGFAQIKTTGLDGWKAFYGIVRDVVKERRIAAAPTLILSPLAIVKDEVRQKEAELRTLKSIGANALGILVREGFGHDSGFDVDVAQANESEDPSPEDLRVRWQKSVFKSIDLFQNILHGLVEPESASDDFDSSSQHLPDTQSSSALLTSIDRMLKILDKSLPMHRTSFELLTRQYGRPSRLVRYWLPATFFFVFSGTILRVISNRKEEFINWVRELGSTVVDFWTNWVIQPVKNIVKTVHHDEGSEISIMSKRSLEADRESLERMVVDFAVDNHGNSTKLSASEMQDIQTKIRDGDMTVVLKAYEQELKSPFYSSVRGKLIRTLLIQIQKTKVDVEVALGGIDSILKSQELVFGFVGLTPGILVCVGVGRWLGGLWRDRKSRSRVSDQGGLMRGLRNIDRLLKSDNTTESDQLTDKAFGLLLCEAYVLSQQAMMVMPRRIYREFRSEVNELVDLKSTSARQVQVAERMRWAYAKWLS